MKTLTQSQLREKLLAIRHATPITISSLTEVKGKNGTGYKLARTNGLTAYLYSRSMERVTGEPFIPQPRSWGRHISPAVIEHKGQHYVQIKIQHRRTPVYFIRQNGLLKTVPVETLGLEPEKERPVVTRDFTLSNLHRITMNGETFNIVADT